MNNYKNVITVGWDETIDVNKGLIKRQTTYPDVDNYEMIISGPHYYVSNPIYKSPRNICKLNSDYDIVDLNSISDNYVQRTNYIPVVLNEEFFKKESSVMPENWIDTYRVGISKMLSLPGERTIQSFIIPPKFSHIYTTISVQFEKSDLIIELCGLTNSIIYDFYIKVANRGAITTSPLRTMPLGVDDKYKSSLFIRTLLLNCITNRYSNIWERNFKELYCDENWSKTDHRLKPFSMLRSKWNWEIPLRSSYERRQALIEIDVIVAIAIGLTIEELQIIYYIQFPVLQENENDTWYDTTGNIVFTCSKGLTGVGVDRLVWNTIKDLKAGQTYEHIIEKSELYYGKKVTYHAPFDKCDRVEDYKIAWAHFERVFNNQKT